MRDPRITIEIRIQDEQGTTVLPTEYPYNPPALWALAAALKSHSDTQHGHHLLLAEAIAVATTLIESRLISNQTEAG